MPVSPVFRAVWSSLCIGVSVFLLAGAVIGLNNFHQPLPYLIDIFTLPLLTLTAGVTSAFFLARKTIAGAIGILASGIWLIALIPQAITSQAPSDETGPFVRLMFANLYIHNKTPERLIEWVNAEQPDIIATVENLSDPADQSKLTDRYPYHYRHRDTVVYSRFPIGLSHAGNTRYSFDMIDIRIPHRQMHLAVVHLCQPKIDTHDCQSSQMVRLREDIPAKARPDVVMVGDFNSSLSAYLLQAFARDMAFKPVAAPTGTWPSVLPGVLRIGIDNAFAGRNFSLSRRKVGPDNGSDHRPIVVDIRPALN